MSGVHYKFSSTLYYDTVTFDGVCIKVPELKKLITDAKKLGKSTDYDLEIVDTQTKRVYGENEEVQKNASVLVRRVPVVQSSFSAKASKTSVTSTISFDKLSETANLVSANASEQDKIKAMFHQSTKDYSPSNYTVKPPRMSGPPPQTYVCYKCQRPGHYIQNCPNAPLVPRLPPGERPKRPTGLPQTSLTAVPENTPGAMMGPTGQWVINEVARAGYQNPKREKPATSLVPTMSRAERQKAADQRHSIPKDLICPLCKDLITEASVIPCCGNSGCDDCVRTELMESDDHQCPICGATGTSPDDIISNNYLRKLVRNFTSETGYHKNQPLGGAAAPFKVEHGSSPHQHQLQLPSSAAYGAEPSSQNSSAYASPQYMVSPAQATSPSRQNCAGATKESDAQKQPRRSTTPTQDEALAQQSASAPTTAAAPAADVQLATQTAVISTPYVQSTHMAYQGYPVAMATSNYMSNQVYIPPNAYYASSMPQQPVVMNGNTARPSQPPLSESEFSNLQRRARDQQRHKDDELDKFLKSIQDRDNRKERPSGSPASNGRSPRSHSRSPAHRRRSGSRSRPSRRSGSRSPPTRRPSRSPQRRFSRSPPRRSSRSPPRRRRTPPRRRKSKTPPGRGKPRRGGRKGRIPPPPLPEFTDPPPHPRVYEDYNKWALGHDLEWVVWYENYKRWFEEKKQSESSRSRSLSPMSDDDEYERNKAIEKRRSDKDGDRKKSKKTKKEKERSEGEKAKKSTAIVDDGNKKEDSPDNDDGWELESDEEAALKPKAAKGDAKSKAAKPVRKTSKEAKEKKQNDVKMSREVVKVPEEVCAALNTILTELERREKYAERLSSYCAEEASQSEEDFESNRRSLSTKTRPSTHKEAADLQKNAVNKEKKLSPKRAAVNMPEMDSRNVVVASATGEELLVHAPDASKWDTDEEDGLTLQPQTKSPPSSKRNDHRSARRVYLDDSKTLQQSMNEKQKITSEIAAENVHVTVSGSKRKTSVAEPLDHKNSSSSKSSAKRVADKQSQSRDSEQHDARKTIHSVILSVDTRKKSTETRTDESESEKRAKDKYRVSEERRYHDNHDYSSQRRSRSRDGHRSERHRSEKDFHKGGKALKKYSEPDENRSRDKLSYRKEEYKQSRDDASSKYFDSFRSSTRSRGDDVSTSSRYDISPEGRYRKRSSRSISPAMKSSRRDGLSDQKYKRKESRRSRSRDTSDSVSPFSDESGDESDRKTKKYKKRHRRSESRERSKNSKPRATAPKRTSYKPMEKHDLDLREKESKAAKERERKKEEQLRLEEIEKEKLREQAKLEEIERMKEQIKEEIRNKEREKLERKMKKEMKKEKEQMRKEAEKKAREEVIREEKERLQKKKIAELERLKEEASFDEKKRYRSTSQSSGAEIQDIKRPRITSRSSSDAQDVFLRRSSSQTRDSTPKKKKDKKAKKEKKKKEKKKKRHRSRDSEDSS